MAFWGVMGSPVVNKQLTILAVMDVVKKVKVKLSRYRPEQALGGSGRLRLRVFSTSAL
jgi:hypothetical protein